MRARKDIFQKLGEYPQKSPAGGWAQFGLKNPAQCGGIPMDSSSGICLAPTNVGGFPGARMVVHW
jgi:hypothetical protein